MTDNKPVAGDKKSSAAPAKQSSLDSRIEQALMRPRTVRIALWQSLLAGMALLLFIVFFGALVIKAGENRAGFAGRAAHAVASTPIIAHRAAVDALNRYKPQLARSQRFDGEIGFKRTAAGADVSGLVLMSRHEGDTDRGIVELFDLKEGKVLHSWSPDILAINALSKLPPDYVDLARAFTPQRYEENHPLPYPDGSIVFQSMGSPLVKVDACARIVWTVDGDFHHSIERDAEGNIWTGERLYPPTIKFVDKEFEDDAIAKISPDGKLLFHKSVAEILINGGLRHLVYGFDKYYPDPVHVNDVQPVLADGPYWKKDDLFVSVRNASMLMLYRPSEDRIVWYKQGPWMMQHDIDIINDHTIAVFSNNMAATQFGSHTIKSNSIIFYDFATGEVSEPLLQSFIDNEIKTETNGLFMIDPDGSVMVEEHDYGRLLGLAPDGELLWTFVNRGPKDGRVFHMGWSRKLDDQLGAAMKASTSAANCAAKK